ncbi:hypothetical protein BT63DRAFT_460111 [Microthyrium microscopicum]|uniref:CENP-V/GFA domain-containing protein n=1 Tax=Microthyrium microscopicum TaxID=703497 RepID=A0A6A6U0H5_9PEZI|nr:hypothetical protein BT63DRAFT_460111 [Microthyrium microscopicum]
MSTEEPKRRVYYGSCSCQAVRYVCWLTLPASPPYNWVDKSKPPPQMIRKCNCTQCHKRGFLHVRVADSFKDFAILSPLDDSELGRAGPSPTKSWPFCKNCGNCCFQIDGETEIVERDLVAEGVDPVKAKIQEGKVKVLMPKAEGWQEEKTNWLRVNAMTLEARQEGFNLMEWHEKGWIQHVNWLDETGGPQYGKPYDGGAY